MDVERQNKTCASKWDMKTQLTMQRKQEQQEKLVGVITIFILARFFLT
jgi:hypothetical protein